MNLERIRLFTAVASAKSFSAAARAQGMSPSAISQQVQLLESELGVKLLHRTTRQVTLTEAGQAFFLRSKSALAELTEAVELVGEQQHTPRGTLRISAPVAFGHMHLLPLLTGFAEKYPDVILETTFDDRMVDPVTEGYDILIRIGPLHDSTLIMKPLGLSPLLLAASPRYLATHGTPQHVNDLKGHRLLAYLLHGTMFEWQYQSPTGQTGHFRAEPALRTNATDLLLASAVQGLGIALLPQFALKSHLENGTLTQVLPTYSTVPLRQIVALTHATRHRTAKVQAFWQHLSTLSKIM